MYWCVCMLCVCTLTTMTNWISSTSPAVVLSICSILLLPKGGGVLIKLMWLARKLGQFVVFGQDLPGNSGKGCLIHSPLHLSQDILHQTLFWCHSEHEPNAHDISTFFFPNLGAKINGFHKRLAQNDFIFTNRQTFQEICDPLAERRLISPAMIFELGQGGIKVATSVCCYPEGKQKCLALNKVHWGSSSVPAESTKWARPPRRPCGRTRHHGSHPQLGDRAGRPPADHIQQLPGFVQLGVNGSRPPHHLLRLLPNLVPPTQRHGAQAHLGGGLGRLAQSSAEMVRMEEVKPPQTYTHQPTHRGKVSHSCCFVSLLCQGPVRGETLLVGPRDPLLQSRTGTCSAAVPHHVWDWTRYSSWHSADQWLTWQS